MTTPEPTSPGGDGCHSAADLDRVARSAGQSELLDQYARDYPQGPHDKPQSMCPAFGSLRVGLRMKRVATVLSGSACCVYGLTFVSHFYGARRSVGYVPFDSESLVTGKLFEDIREAVHKLADPDRFDAIVVTNLCVPTASGVPLRLLPDEIDGVRIVGIDVPGEHWKVEFMEDGDIEVEIFKGDGQVFDYSIIEDLFDDDDDDEKENDED